ncbi:UNVERIFIED_CONTAM: DExH-box ATP-dependent RNA helicase DExH14 [Sesamum calycinum]|uniref:DExH-box ATP-dependent RNA helicase DExH14 n=1 Tax=Sesamum calycinum TaxID=2727403 RepID=A0AAW2PR90_9LAMI
MLLELPRLTNSLRLPFDADQAYLNRKSYLQDLSRRSSAASLGEWELARKIIYRWDEASVEVRQLYKQFIAAVVELMGGEVVSQEFQEVALNAYRLFGAAYGSEEDDGDIVPMIFKVEICQPRYLVKNEHGTGYLPELVSEVSEDLEFGADLVFRPPARFLVDISLEDAEILVEETSTSSSNHERWSDYGASANFHPSVSEGNFDLEWLRDTCDRIIRASSSQLPRDELAMTICRILDSDKPGDEIAGDLLDLVGDSSFETVQDLVMHRKDLVESIHRGLLVLKSDKSTSNTQVRLPSYATQVTVQTESERQIDKLRRKEEKKHRRGTDHGIENELSSLSFSSLLQASEKKNFLDDIVGHGDGTQFAATALPQGTVRKHYKGYEEVTIPPTPTAPMKPGEKLIEIKELDDIAQAAFHGYKSLNRIQSRIFQTTYYSMCTYWGWKNKYSYDFYSTRGISCRGHINLQPPIIPLNVTVRELTGDMQLSKNELEETQMIVTTPEKWDVITRKSSDMSLSMLVKLLIIDEVHLLNDDRGPVIEALVARTLRQVAQFLRVNPETGLFFFDSSYRPVPLEQHYIGISEHNFLARNELMNEICYNKVVDSLRRGHQVMVFVHSRKDTGKTADKLKEVLKSRNKELVQLFEYAVGIHHAGMLRSDRGLTERLFSEGLLRVLVCTATLAWGVNLPAHTVVIKGTQVYDPKAGGWRDLGMLDVMQIFGRAGRPQFDKSGEGIIITSHDKLAYYLRLLTSQLPIESQFINSLKDNLNAEVALGTVTNVKEACAWLGHCRSFIEPETRALVSDAARALDKAKMMRFDEKSGNFYCTELGRIASHFYIQYSSVETYNEMLRRHMNDSEVIDMVAHSSEFENIVVREEEQSELEIVTRTCPLEVKGGPSSKHGKVSILIQLYISRGSIDTFSLVSDASYISSSLARIMRALFEICLRRGWSEMSSFLLEYCKAVDRQVWPHQHPLRQFDREISTEVLRKLEERGVDLDRLYEMEEKEIGALIRYAPGGKLVGQAILGIFPNGPVICYSKSNHKDCSKGNNKLVDLTITQSSSGRIGSMDSENDHIYHSELFTLTKKMAKGEPQKLSFTVPIFEPHPPQYFIRAISDSWLHAESFYTISLQNLALPEAHTTHTELLDLKPLPVTALGNETYEAFAFHVLYHTDQNVLLGAPTGSGKTISAELAMLHLFNSQPDMKVIYIAPLKALVRERMNDWRKRLVSRLGKHMVELTGDYTPDLTALLEADIIISTPEKWDGISRNWHTRGYVKKVGLMILDEIHLLGADRGPILEVIVSRMRYISSQTERSVRFVGLSTALANAHDLADWLGVEENGLFNFKPSVRPVPLEVHIQGYPGKFYCPRMNSMNKPTYAAICTHSPTKPVLIFVSSRRQTRLTALDLIQYAASDEHPRQFLSIPEESLQMVLSQVADQNLRHTLQFGIGLHHAGLNDKDRSLVEELFANNKIQVLVCTSTLAWGVNLPAHLVIIKGTEYFDGKAKRYVDFPITDILQMMGRAGRPQYDQHGKAIILVHEPKKSFYKKFLYEPFPVESSLREQLHDHINAEIVSGTISHKEDAVHYLTWTYLFRRLVVNPAYYGLEDTDPGTLSSYLSSLVLSTFEDLEDSGCIKIDEDRVEPMMLGSIASQYYLKYTTVSMFASNIEADTSLEENYNAQLSNKVRYMVDKNLLDDPHVKANLLLQAHFSRVEMPITDYVTDLKSVLDQSIRIIQAMIDLCANSGWLSSTLTCMHLLQMIMQGLWFDKDSPLWMLPSMTDELVTTLSQRGVLNIQQLLDLPPTTLQALARSSTASRLHEELQHFPRIQARIKVQKRTAGDNPGVSLNIRLEKANRHKKTSRAFTPRFPKVKDEAWWLVLGNTSTSQLYALKRVTFTDVLQTHMNIPSNVNDFQGMKLIIVSDCYVGFEQEHIIEKLV